MMLLYRALIKDNLLPGRFVEVWFMAGDLSAFRPGESVTAWERDKVWNYKVLLTDLIDVMPLLGPLAAWYELKRIRARAWIYTMATRLLVKFNKWLPETSENHRWYYWFVKNGGVKRVSQHGAFQCDHWRPIVNEADLADFHRDLLRCGFWDAY